MSDGEAALHALRQNPQGYDAVLTDLVEIRKIRPNLPVILTSNPDDRNRAGRWGGTILIKPVNTKELLSVLVDLFEKRQEAQRN